MFRKPVEIAQAYPAIGEGKVAAPAIALLFRAMLAGACVAFATMCSHSIAVLISDPGTSKLIGALLFPTGLGMILLCGGELFTGNCLLTLSVWSKKISLMQLLKNLTLVYLGNLLGSLLIAWMAIASRPSDAVFFQATVYAASAKTLLPFEVAMLRGILCNILVCAAVWMSYSTDSATGKLLAMYLPVVLFILCGMEHCVANMYTFSAALLARGGVPLYGVLRNLAASTLGNILGGSVFFAGAIWMSFPVNKRTV